jgi:tetratricopeptide (TPR) repeat protein
MPELDKEPAMTLASRHIARLSVLALSVVGLSACATGLPNVQAGDVPRLQQEVAASPDDTDLQVQLGMAQFKAGDFDASRTTLQGAVDAGNESGAALLYLGMVQEELQDWSAAREAYTRYLTVGTSSQTMDEVRKRLTLIGRNLLRAQAQQALAQESQIAGSTSVTPQSVAVLPLAFNSERTDLEPLVYALSDMMTTDFAVSNALVVLERAQIQALLDEMALTSSGYAEPTTGARAGRLLRAEHVFQGVLTTLPNDELQTDANVLNVPNTSSEGQLTEGAALDQLFDMEKQIVIRTIREVLGVELTPAEEQAILDNRMSNVLAFLAYGRGLREIDRGDYAAAQAEFNQSLQLEPGGFASRDAAMSQLSDLVDASAFTTADIGGLASSSGELGLGAFAPPAAITTQGLFQSSISGQTTSPLVVSGTLSNVTEGVAPTPTGNTLNLGSTQQSRGQATKQTQDTNRDPVQESQGQETVPGTAEAQIVIVIQRPGGQP